MKKFRQTAWLTAAMFVISAWNPAESRAAEQNSSESLWESLPVVVDYLGSEEEVPETVWDYRQFLPGEPGLESAGEHPAGGTDAPDLPEIGPERLPSRWYAGDHGKKPMVRHQGSYGTCWTLAAVSALEASLLPEHHFIFSADHMARKNAFTVDINEGGDYLMAMAYLSSWQGPVTEAEDPYGDGFSPDGLAPAVHVQEMQIFENAEPERIKDAVRSYGAVQTSLYMSRNEMSDYNEKTRAYYYPDERLPNHDVVILGWDDDFSRFLFQEIPDRDGAYICQNTWEDGFGEDGIFYVSYADPNIGKRGVCYSGIEPADNYSRIYQYDDCGWQGRQGYGDETCWFANIYTAADDELLKAVGFYVVGPDTSYEIYYVPGFQDGKDFSERKFLQSGTISDMGYYTVKFDSEQRLSQGERFAVIVKITTPGEKTPVAVEFRTDQYTQNVTTEGKEGYLSQDGEFWENTEQCFGTNVCLKAYTLF